MEGVKDRLGDLSWLGINDQAWIEVEVPDPVVEINFKEIVDNQIQHFLQESLPMVAVDNLNMTKEQRAAWIEYRQALQNLHLHPNYPHEINWPIKPE
jgi:hypothetical protein